MTLDLSVVICTYNRAELLEACLQDLCDQGVGSSRFGILVVDNNSKDETKEKNPSVKQRRIFHRGRI